MRLYYVVNARIPNEKAHGIQVSHMLHALEERGVRLTLIHPERKPGGMYSWGRRWYAISSFLFMLRSAALLFVERIRGERFCIYTIDMDTFSYALLPLVAPTFAEMHSPKRSTVLNRFFFARAHGIIATTHATKHELQKTFGIPDERITVEPNGVSVAAFSGIGKEEARTKLSLPLHDKIAVYVGRFYEWKGLEILPRAFKSLPAITAYIVGGDQKEFEALVSDSASQNMRFPGVRPSGEIPLWLAAADALIVLGTAKNEDSMRYTSPMKVFEYLAAERPIVASRTKALEEVLTSDSAYWYEPDNADSLAHAIQKAVSGKAEPGRAAGHDWSARAARIVHFIEHAR